MLGMARPDQRWLAPYAQPLRTSERSECATADWSRERCRRFEWQPSRQLIRAIRAYQRLQSRRGWLARLQRKLLVAEHAFWSVVTATDVPLNCDGIGGGLLMPHPQGVVIHPEARVGRNCLIMQGVTIGTGPRPGTPVIGDGVDIYAGAKVLGGVMVGDGAVIGSNAVVIGDVPAGCLAVGIPAVIKRKARQPHQSESPAWPG